MNLVEYKITIKSIKKDFINGNISEYEFNKQVNKNRVIYYTSEFKLNETLSVFNKIISFTKEQLIREFVYWRDEFISGGCTEVIYKDKTTASTIFFMDTLKSIGVYGEVDYPTLDNLTTKLISDVHESVAEKLNDGDGTSICSASNYLVKEYLDNIITIFKNK